MLDASGLVMASIGFVCVCVSRCVLLLLFFAVFAMHECVTHAYTHMVVCLDDWACADLVPAHWVAHKVNTACAGEVSRIGFTTPWHTHAQGMQRVTH